MIGLVFETLETTNQVLETTNLLFETTNFLFETTNLTFETINLFFETTSRHQSGFRETFDTTKVFETTNLVFETIDSMIERSGRGTVINHRIRRWSAGEYSEADLRKLLSSIGIADSNQRFFFRIFQMY